MNTQSPPTEGVKKTVTFMNQKEPKVNYFKN